MSSAETQAKREKKLEHFFREAYAVTFGNKKHEKSQVQFNPGLTLLSTDLFCHFFQSR